jgi:hypothetical protein
MEQDSPLTVDEIVVRRRSEGEIFWAFLGLYDLTIAAETRKEQFEAVAGAKKIPSDGY